MKRKRLMSLCMCIAVLSFSVVVLASPVPDTGQTKCYDIVGNVITCPSLGQELFGQDANFTLYPPSYTKMDSLGNTLPDAATSWAMVRDNVTGLIWEVKRNYDNYTLITDLHDADNEYPWNDPPNEPPFSYSVHEFIDALNEAHFGNFSDWRLPSIKELNYIFLHSEESQKNDYIVINKSKDYWSSTSSACLPDYAWVVDFMYCTEGTEDKSRKMAAMAVRGGQSVNSATMSPDSADSGSQDGASTAAAYRDNGDGTVTDLSTDLMWQKEATDYEKDWNGALFRARQATTGGYRDWRLPTIKELQSLMDYSRYNPAINPIFSAPDNLFAYWSSTSYFMRPWDAFFVNYTGKSDFISKGTEFHIRLVRGGPLLPFLSVKPASQNVTFKKGSTMFKVSNDGTGIMHWKLEQMTGEEWLYIFPEPPTDDNIVCYYAENTGPSARTATIRVTADGAIGSPMDVTVTQAGAPQLVASHLLGVWSDAVWAWYQPAKQWTKIPSTSNAMMIAAGKVDSDTLDDLIGVWPSGLWVRYASTGQWIKPSSNLPTWIAAGDFNNDGRDDVVGTWKNDGVYVRDSATGKWTEVTTPARQLAAGNVCGHVGDDLIGVWDSGLWIGNSSTETWQKIDPTIPVWIASGDMTGDKRADIIGSYSSGTWYRNSATGAWVKMTTSAEQVTAGDIDGDGRDDLIGVWSSGLWVRYGATGKWQQITASKPKWITTGRITDAVQAAGSLEDPLKSTDGMDILDLSQEGPGGVAADMLFKDEDGPIAE